MTRSAAQPEGGVASWSVPTALSMLRPTLEAPMLQGGSRAPGFSVPDETGELRNLKEFAGKTVVLWFYPRADTPG